MSLPDSLSSVASTIGEYLVSLQELYPYLSYAGGAVVVAIVARWLSRRHHQNPRGLPYPPGPRGWPIVGIYRDIPKKKPWAVSKDWSKKYGDLIFYQAMGHNYLIVQSLRRSNDLFDKRSMIYSDRPPQPMAVDLMGWSFNLAWQPYGDWWRRHRKAFHEHFNPNIIEKYDPIQTQEHHQFLVNLLREPAAFSGHVHQEAKRAEKITDRLVFKPYQEVKGALQKGVAEPSVVAALISELPPEDDATRAEQERIAADVGAVAYVAGADTTGSALLACFIGLAKNADAQRKAQAEIDAAVGPNRLPDATDRPLLPYVDAIILETIRWRLVVPFKYWLSPSLTPTAIAHMTSEDDEYDGAMLNDEELFEEPSVFNPDRYFNNPGTVKPEVAFCFGRRYFSDKNLFAIIAAVFAVYDILPPLTRLASQLRWSLTLSRGLSPPFSVRIVPRNQTATQLVRDLQQ
ncbi:cytochrome P450 [Panaeolus papilionaceus]|nr:cytochrome P450 [Panaeolus papilionaceus]